MFARPAGQPCSWTKGPAADRPSCLAKTLTLDITRKIFNHCLIPAMLYRLHWLLPFCTAFSDNNNNDHNRIERSDSRFFTISSQSRELSPTRTLKWPGRNRVQITCNTSSAYHVQPAVCHLVRRDSPAVKFDRVEIAFILAFFFFFFLLDETISRCKRGGNRSSRR